METTSTSAIPVTIFESLGITPAQSLLMAGSFVLVVILLGMWVATRNNRALLHTQFQSEERAREAEMQMHSILKSQAEMQGRMQTMAELFGSRQAELNKSIRDRLDGMTHHLGRSIHEQTRSTHENLSKLQERLAVIDTAQNNIQSLAGQVVQLQAILANKQTRGAFGQSRMEAIIADGLPMNAYQFQATLTNGTRPDCLVKMPNGTASLVVDAKFPLESWNALKASETPEAKRHYETLFRRDMEVHIRDIAAKYFITGETQDTAFLFVPSESIFAEIHENFEMIIQRAHRARVVIVSPSLLMLSIQVIQSVLKDARMREQAHLIQAEVVRLMDDVSRLDERVRKLQTHFSQVSRDIDDILISSSKVTRRSAKIEALELSAAENQVDQKPVEAPESGGLQQDFATGSPRLI
ncbi:DNA recombination protein RmuC [Pseudochrobactrum sp. MP213Fo]|uniref:DNA recombination protein RmuC n=1 Tax=Pseudochrobactrum sp. MP213Fo TaxID=3022250 RepID=UPI003BA234AC